MASSSSNEFISGAIGAAGAIVAALIAVIVPKHTTHLKVGRDVVLITLGVIGITYETVVAQADRPWLLGVLLVCVVLPSFWRTQGKP